MYTPQSLTACPGEMVVGRRSFPIWKISFQERAVKLWEGIKLSLRSLLGGCLKHSLELRIIISLATSFFGMTLFLYLTFRLWILIGKITPQPTSYNKLAARS